MKRRPGLAADGEIRSHMFYSINGCTTLVMNDHTDFFGDVFESPEDDPLLGGEGERSGEDEQSAREQGPPSWMQDDQESREGAADAPQDPTHDSGERGGPERKEIVVDQEEQRGLTELNEAVGQGWRLVQISLDRPSGQQAASRREAKRFVAVLEQEGPQSLFDFGAP